MQAEIQYQDGACHSYSLDLTIGCSHSCIYCYFSAFQMAAYRQAHRDQKGEVVVLQTSELLAASKYPAQIYLSNSTDPFSPQASGATHEVLSYLLPKGVQFFILTKGIIPDQTIGLLDQYGSQVSVQVGITNLSTERNRLIEPGVPSASRRLGLLSKLNETNIAVVAARMDPLFPLIDDEDHELDALTSAIAQTGTKNVVASYVLLTATMIRHLAQVPSASPAMAKLTEKTPTISSNDLYSVPLAYKIERLTHIRRLCINQDIKCNTCACKDRRLALTELPFICHPRDTDAFVGNYVSPGKRSEPIELSGDGGAGL